MDAEVEVEEVEKTCAAEQGEFELEKGGGQGEVVEGLPGGKNQPGVARPGDLVAIDPSLHCGRCRRCRQGHGNLCENWGSIGGTRPGAWADYIAVPMTIMVAGSGT